LETIGHGPQQFFIFYFFQFCDVAQVAIIHMNILAKFGNIRNMKVKKILSTLFMLEAVVVIFCKFLFSPFR
jgi:hypothetical protein